MKSNYKNNYSTFWKFFCEKNSQILLSLKEITIKKRESIELLRNILKKIVFLSGKVCKKK